MLFKYKGIDKNSKRVKGYIEAKDIEEAKLKLKSRDIIYSLLKEKKRFFDFDIFKKEIPSKQLATISRNLSIYLKSGVSSVVYAVKLEKNHYSDDNKLSSFFNSLEELLSEGKSFYGALEAQSVYKIPGFYKHSIKVAEESGSLSRVLKEMSVFMKNQDMIKSKVASAMVYPFFIIFVSILMVGFMLSFVVPKITAMFEGLNQQLPKITQFVIYLGDGVKENWLIIISFLMIAFFIFIYVYRRFVKIRYLVDMLLLKLPLFGKIIETSELAKFSYMVSVLLSSGVTFVQAIKLSSSTLKNEVLSELFKNSSNELVKGKKLSNSMLKGKYKIDKSFIQAISLGEETSQMREILENLSELYAQENSEKIDMLLSLLEPVLILFVGVVIGFIVVAMLLPIFSMNLTSV